EITQASVLQVNIVTFAFYVLGFNLRHTHIWLPLTGFWGRVFISPAHHQIHHSRAPEHHDRNYGLIFAFWDLAAGSLCVPEKSQKIEYGLAGEDSLPYRSVKGLYLTPVIETWRALRGRVTGAPAARVG
ncbi:MAG: sterol desaturase family protein, partial [Pseudomonadota bacterium]